MVGGGERRRASTSGESIGDVAVGCWEVGIGLWCREHALRWICGDSFELVG
jgi:hypothetical protein